MIKNFSFSLKKSFTNNYFEMFFGFDNQKHQITVIQFFTLVFSSTN